MDLPGFPRPNRSSKSLLPNTVTTFTKRAISDSALNNRIAKKAPYTVAALLLAASGLKTVQLFLSPADDALLGDSRILTVLVIEFEILLTGWLISGIAQRPARAFAIITFVVFAVASLKMALEGQSSCGCFGLLKVNPWITLLIDLATITLLMKWQPAAAAAKAHKTRRWFVVILAGWMLLAAFMAQGPSTLSISDLAGMDKSSGFVIVEPEKWIGERLPLLPFIETDHQIASGPWLLVLVHHDCDMCQLLVSQLNAKDSTEPTKTLLVEVAPNNEPWAFENGSLFLARLNRQHEWFAKVPAMIEIDNGVVRNVVVRDQLRKRLREQND